MLRYPLDPEHARILISSFSLGCPKEIIDVLSLIVSGPVWIDRPSDRDSAVEARAKFIHRDGDHLTGLNVLRAYTALNENKPRWCKANHVNIKTLSAALKVRDQLRELAERDGKDWKVSCGSEAELVMRCLLQGLFMNSAVIQPDGGYRQTAGNLVRRVDPHGLSS